MSLCCHSWFGNLSLQDKNSLNQIIKRAGRLIGESQLNMSALFDAQLQLKASTNLNAVVLWSPRIVPTAVAELSNTSKR